MALKNKRPFLTWNRENQAEFAAAVAAELEAKADLSSPKFKGIPTAPTAETGTSNEQIATTAFVIEALADIPDTPEIDTSEFLSKTGDTMTGNLIFNNAGLSLQYNGTGISSIVLDGSTGLYINGTTSIHGQVVLQNGRFAPRNMNSVIDLGTSYQKWQTIFALRLNNGADIAIPDKAGTLALLSDIPDAPEIDTSEFLLKTGDTMTDVLEFNFPPSTPSGYIYPIVLKGKFTETNTEYVWKLGISTIGTQFRFRYNTQDVIAIVASVGIIPVVSSLTLGDKKLPWAKTFTQKLNNGLDTSEDIIVPSKGGTLALVSDIEDVLRQYGLIQ
jgi:hypothetical protein